MNVMGNSVHYLFFSVETIFLGRWFKVGLNLENE